MPEEINFVPLFEYIDAKNDELLEQMQGIFVTKDDIGAINNRLDELVVIVRKLDEDSMFTVEWIRRIENEVDSIKKHLQIV